MNNKHPFLNIRNTSESVKYVDYYCDFYVKNSGPDHLAQLGLMPQMKEGYDTIW